MAERRLLILGGTAEARRLAEALQNTPLPGLSVVTSLAGRTQTPRAPAGELRVGGFGGVRGLADYLRVEQVAAVIDATHPFAARVSANAFDACLSAGVPRLLLRRPPWQPQPGDMCAYADDFDHAARLVPRLGNRVFLALGSGGLAPFAGLEGVDFVVRVIDPPRQSLALPEAQVIVGRPPFTVEDETALMGRHRINLVVARDSGGEQGRAKLDAARGLGIPVLLIRRPLPEPGDQADTVEQALSWLRGRV